MSLKVYNRVTLCGYWWPASAYTIVSVNGGGGIGSCFMEPGNIIIVHLGRIFESEM